MDEDILVVGPGSGSDQGAEVIAQASAANDDSHDEPVPEARSQSPSVSEGSWVAEVGCLGSRCCDPRQGPYRFLALAFMCFLGFGSYFCYDTPASLQNEIKEDMGVSTLQFSTLYSLYSWPNVVLCFVGGFLIDRVFGIRLGTLIFSTIVTMGQFVYAFGALIDAFWVMQLGRFIFGVGGESLAVAQNAYTVSWFKGKELNTVFGLQLSMARIGSTVNFLVMEPIYNWVDGMEDGHTTLGISLIIAGATCVFSLICAVVIAVLDRRRSRLLHLSSTQVGEKIQLRDIGGFPLSFWLLCVICVAYYSAIFPFIGLSKVFFMYKYDMKSAAANSVSSIVYVISAVCSPLFGFLVDKTGRNIMWVAVAITVTLGAHSMLAFSFINPYVAMVVMGLSYSLLASSLWPMVALIVPESQLGTAYGIMQSIQNLGLALVSMLSGFVVDQYGYLMLEVLNLICVSIALGCTFVIMLTDATQDGGYLMQRSAGRAKEAPCVKRMEERARRLRGPGGLDVTELAIAESGAKGGQMLVVRELLNEKQHSGLPDGGREINDGKEGRNDGSGSSKGGDDGHSDAGNGGGRNTSLLDVDVRAKQIITAFVTDEKQHSAPNEVEVKGNENEYDSPAPKYDSPSPKYTKVPTQEGELQDAIVDVKRKQEDDAPVQKEDDAPVQKEDTPVPMEENTSVSKEEDTSATKNGDTPLRNDEMATPRDDSPVGKFDNDNNPATSEEKSPSRACND